MTLVDYATGSSPCSYPALAPAGAEARAGTAGGSEVARDGSGWFRRWEARSSEFSVISSAPTKDRTLEVSLRRRSTSEVDGQSSEVRRSKALPTFRPFDRRRSTFRTSEASHPEARRRPSRQRPRPPVANRSRHPAPAVGGSPLVRRRTTGVATPPYDGYDPRVRPAQARQQAPRRAPAGRSRIGRRRLGVGRGHVACGRNRGMSRQPRPAPRASM